MTAPYGGHPHFQHGGIGEAVAAFFAGDPTSQSIEGSLGRPDSIRFDVVNMTEWGPRLDMGNGKSLPAFPRPVHSDLSKRPGGPEVIEALSKAVPLIPAARTVDEKGPAWAFGVPSMRFSAESASMQSPMPKGTLAVYAELARPKNGRAPFWHRKAVAMLLDEVEPRLSDVLEMGGWDPFLHDRLEKRGVLHCFSKPPVGVEPEDKFLAGSRWLTFLLPLDAFLDFDGTRYSERTR